MLYKPAAAVFSSSLLSEYLCIVNQKQALAAQAAGKKHRKPKESDAKSSRRDKGVTANFKVCLGSVLSTPDQYSGT